MGDFHLLFFASFLAHSELGQNRKSSMRAHVFRFAPNSGHRLPDQACPKSAIDLRRSSIEPLGKYVPTDRDSAWSHQQFSIPPWNISKVCWHVAALIEMRLVDTLFLVFRSCCAASPFLDQQRASELSRALLGPEAARKLHLVCRPANLVACFHTPNLGYPEPGKGAQR